MEQSNEEMAEKDFLLTENEINLKELEAAVKTFNCTLQEKDKLLQVLGLGKHCLKKHTVLVSYRFH